MEVFEVQLLEDLSKKMGVTQHEIILDAVRGCTPNYSAMDHPLVKSHGTYYDQYGRWDWKDLEDCQTSELLLIYKLCKVVK